MDEHEEIFIHTTLAQLKIEALNSPPQDETRHDETIAAVYK